MKINSIFPNRKICLHRHGRMSIISCRHARHPSVLTSWSWCWCCLVLLSSFRQTSFHQPTPSSDTVHGCYKTTASFWGAGPPGVSRQLSPEQPRMLLLLPTMSHSLSNYTPYGHCFLHLQVDLPRTNLHCRGKEIRNAFSAPARPIGGYRMAHRHRMTSLSFPSLDAGMDAGWTFFYCVVVWPRFKSISSRTHWIAWSAFLSPIARVKIINATNWVLPSLGIFCRSAYTSVGWEWPGRSQLDGRKLECLLEEIFNQSISAKTIPYSRPDEGMHTGRDRAGMV